MVQKIRIKVAVQANDDWESFSVNQAVNRYLLKSLKTRTAKGDGLVPPFLRVAFDTEASTSTAHTAKANLNITCLSC